MDWWFAARPEIAKSWIDISEKWDAYKARLQQLHIARWFSHYIWAIHVHDMLNASSNIRFRPGVRVNLVRHSYGRLRMAHGQSIPLGEYVTDAIGNCDILDTVDNRSISSEALMSTLVKPNSVLGRRFVGRYMPMAEQCAVARLDDPVVCCGEPRRCGKHSCGTQWTRAYARFLQAGRRASRQADLNWHAATLL